MVRATRAELGEAWGVLRVDKAEDFLVVLHGGDETPRAADLAAQPGEQAAPDFGPNLLREGSVAGAAENFLFAPVGRDAFLDRRGGALDELQ